MTGPAPAGVGLLATAAARRAEPVDPDHARDVAREILGGRRYHGRDTPRPLEGVLRWVGDRLRPVGDAISRVVDALGWPGVVAVALALLIAAVFAYRARTAARGTPEAGGDGSSGGPADPGAAELERLAAEAEARGDHGTAVRLRFRAGLVRLDSARAIRLRPSLTSGQAARRVGSGDLDELAVTFDTVAYGERPGTAEQSEHARLAWPRVLAAVRADPGAGR